jgi:uncharacterized repeat protein (TIGR01451 family)
MIRRLTLLVTLAAMVSAIFAATAPAIALAATPYQDIASAGPLEHVYLGNDLSCQVAHTGDTALEFYHPSEITGDCGTFVAIGGTLFAPDFSDQVSATAGIGAYTAFTPVSQSTVTGTGTAASPFQVITVADVGTTGLRIQQTDSYVIGDEAYRTSIVVSNTGQQAVSGILYRAGDCFLGGSDNGYGFTEVFGTRKAVGCSVNANNSPAGRIEEWVPLTGGNNFYESFYGSVWDWIGGKTAFPDTCDCGTLQDNGAGVSWSFAVGGGASLTYAHATTFSPTGKQALETTKTADAASSAAGATNGYTISISNPNPDAVTLNSITDSLPAGFSYVAGSTTGVTTSDPSIVGQNLTWTGPHSVPANGSASLHFSVTVSSTPGTYLNEAGGDAASGYTVLPSGPTASITVVGGAKSTSTTYDGVSGVQYSDAAALSATLLDTSVSPNVGVSGKQLGFTLGTQSASAGPTDAAGHAATSLVVTQQPGSVVTVASAFAGDATYLASADSDPFAIAKEDCTVVYTGDVLVNASSMTTLSAQFGELDASPGSWSGKTVTFTLTDASLAVTTYTAVTDAAGLASTTAALGPNVYAVGVSFAGDDFYLACASAEDTLVTVAAATAKITGGGWISQTVGRTSFGFNVISDVTGLKGQLQVRTHGSKNRYHAGTVLTLDASAHAGTWTGTGRWNGVAGYTFRVSVVDNGTSGKKGDTISIEITSPTNVIVFTTNGAQPLKGGNIVVH